MNEQLWRDYALFHKGQAESRDLDPTYPVLSHIGDALGLNREQRIWLTFLHVTYYHLGSALAAYARTPNPAPLAVDLLRLPTGTERRAHRVPNKLAAHVISLLGCADAYGGLAAWVDCHVRSDPVDTWNSISDMLTVPVGNGRWAAYKTSEMLWKINNISMFAPDMGHAHSSGPRRGLEILFDGMPAGNSDHDVETLNKASSATLTRLADLGVDAAVEEAETSLCDFHSTVKGRYYVGHDIDAMMEQLARVPSDLTKFAIYARAASIPANYLGELNNWSTVDKERNKHYARTGEVILR